MERVLEGVEIITLSSVGNKQILQCCPCIRTSEVWVVVEFIERVVRCEYEACTLGSHGMF